MQRIPRIDPETAPNEVKSAIETHIAQGHRITNEKLTLLHNVTAFNSLEVASYAIDDELQRLIGKRDADFFEYAISLENDCAVCSVYFKKLLDKNGIDFETFEFTNRENLLIEYGRAIAKNPKNVSDELFSRLKAEFTDEEIVVITTMGVFMVANNYFNDIIKVEPEKLSD